MHEYDDAVKSFYFSIYSIFYYFVFEPNSKTKDLKTFTFLFMYDTHVLVPN